MTRARAALEEQQGDDVSQARGHGDASRKRSQAAPPQCRSINGKHSADNVTKVAKQEHHVQVENGEALQLVAALAAAPLLAPAAATSLSLLTAAAAVDSSPSSSPISLAQTPLEALEHPVTLACGHNYEMVILQVCPAHLLCLPDIHEWTLRFDRRRPSVQGKLSARLVAPHCRRA